MLIGVRETISQMRIDSAKGQHLHLNHHIPPNGRRTVHTRWRGSPREDRKPPGGITTACQHRRSRPQQGRAMKLTEWTEMRR